MEKDENLAEEETEGVHAVTWRAPNYRESFEKMKQKTAERRDSKELLEHTTFNCFFSRVSSPSQHYHNLERKHLSSESFGSLLKDCL